MVFRRKAPGMSAREPHVERLTAWQCIGCGRLEGPQPCIGVCQDRRIELVRAADHDAVLERAARAEQRAAVLGEFVRRLATTTPREGEWERGYRALQARARELLRLPGGE